MTTSLLSLYQRDVEAAVPALTEPVGRAAEWIDLVRDYSEQIKERYFQADDVSRGQKRIAADCLYLAVQSLQIGSSAANAMEAPRTLDTRSMSAPRSSKETVFAVIGLCLGVFNLWLGNVPGVISVLALLVLFVHFHWDEIAILNRSLPWQNRSRQDSAAGSERAVQKAAAVLHVKSAIEPILRRTDDIIRSAEPRTEGPPPGLKATTLEFFQDILEAKLNDDKDYAFKKISRTVGQVLLAEGIELATDAEAHLAMFRLDTIVDADRANQFQTIRPALTQNAKCLLPGYARHFVAA